MRTPREIYADHAATTPPAPEVLEAMKPWLGERFGNPSSVHRRGEAAREAVESARGAVADLIGAQPEEIVFTASGSEANNLALQGVLRASPRERSRLVVSAIEHPSVLETARALESTGSALTVAAVGADSVIDLDRLEEALAEDVALVSVMRANNETGVLQPIEEVVARARAVGARTHVDAVQAVGKIPVDVSAWGADLVSLAGHKFQGPPGAGALYVRRRTRLVPLVHGGHQERGRRAGTENVAAIVGLGAAAARAARGMAAESARLERLGGRLLAELEARVPHLRLHGDRQRRLPSILNIGVGGVDGEAMLHELDRAGITVSTGSACSAASPGPSHVLLAMGLSAEDAHGSLRISLGAANDESDVETIVREIVAAAEHLRALDPPEARRWERSA